MEEKKKARLILKRITHHKTGTYGVLVHDNLPFAVTFENPWLNNLPFKSCIPAGVYPCQYYNSIHHGYTFQVHDVENRSGIVFHCGNDIKDTKGCILVGEYFNGSGIAASKSGYREFHYILKGLDKFKFEVIAP